MNRWTDAQCFLAMLATVTALGELSCWFSGRTETGVLILAGMIVAGVAGFAAIRRFERYR